MITLEEIKEVFAAADDLAVALHESIWEDIREDLAQGRTRNQVKPLVEFFGGKDHPLMRPDALHWDRLVIRPFAEKEWPEHIAILRENWPGSALKHPPVTRLAVLLWLEQLYHPDLGETTLTDILDLFPERSAEGTRQAEYRRQCRDLLKWQLPGTIQQTVSTRIRSARARQAVLLRDEVTR